MKLKTPKFWIITLAAQLIVFILGTGIGVFLNFTLPECRVNPPHPARNAILHWDKNTKLGALAKYDCDNETDDLYQKILICNESGQWEMLYRQECQCKSAPLMLENSIVDWSGSGAINETVTFWCADNPKQHIAVVTQCARTRSWNLVTERSCNCELQPPPSYHDYVYDPMTEQMGKNIDVFVTRLCVRQHNSPPFQYVLCNDMLKWVILGQDSCECDEEIPEAQNIRTMTHKSWSRVKRTYNIGTQVAYHCTTNPKSATFMIVRCDVRNIWKVIYQNEENCNPWYMLIPPQPYDKSVQWCNQRGGQYFQFRHIIHSDFIAQLVQRFPKKYECLTNQFYIGIKDNENNMWSSTDRTFWKTENLRKLWAENHPYDTLRACVVIDKRGRLQNVYCTSLTCLICETTITISYNVRKYVLIDANVSFQKYEAECSKHGYFKASLDNEKIHHDISRVMVTTKNTTCSTAYVGLFLFERDWQYENGQKITVAFWENGEPKHFDEHCAITTQQLNYVHWKTSSCESQSCGICEMTSD